MASVGDRIRELREKRKLTQEKLAGDADISKGFLSDVENNNRNISSQGLLKIANVLGASVDYLLRGETKEATASEPVIVPPDLSRAAEEMKLTYSETLELLSAYQSIVARRSNKSIKTFTVEDWKQLRKAIKGVFGS